MTTQKTCFIIAPIGEEASETRKRSDQVLKHVFKPAATECGYNAIRADEISEPGIITSQIIQHIVEDPLVIADLTDRNPNVFYELALRHAIKKPLVQAIRKGDNLPFDVAGMRTIPIDHHDLDSVEEGRKELAAQIRAVEKKSPAQIETPVSVSLELQQLRQSDNPEQRTLADLLSAVTEIRTGLNNLDKKVSAPESLLPPSYLRMIAKDLTMRPSRVSERFMVEVEFLLRRLMESECVNKKSKDYEEFRLHLDHLRLAMMREMEGVRRSEGSPLDP